MAPILSPDILVLVFETLSTHLDYVTLCNAGLASREWRSLSLPALIKHVDVSSHNNGRQREWEYPVYYPVVNAEDSWEYRQPNLIKRQRAFVRLLVEQPKLARHVHALSWTLIWQNIVGEVGPEEIEGADEGLTDLDLRTWDVFASLTNVKYLDLASLHTLNSPEYTYVRQSPAVLFPAVTDLRLLGWTHRGLVRSIFSSIDATKLRSLRLDYLNDEGSLPDGRPMSDDTNNEHSRLHRHGSLGSRQSQIISPELRERQETGKAFIFPGPMWYPMHLLTMPTARPLSSLKHLQVKIPRVHHYTDTRVYETVFRATADLVSKASATLTTLVIVLGEHDNIYKPKGPGQCGTTHMRHVHEYVPFYIRSAAALLGYVLRALEAHSYPRLETLTFEGFTIVDQASERDAAQANLDETWELIKSSRWYNKAGGFTKVPSVDHRRIYHGCDEYRQDLSGFGDMWETS
nr:hypothetical protein B0A51_05340 [Rachicladosporium sp. CCFEE 5018]